MHQAYQSIVTMESSLRLPEKAWERVGFPWQAFAASLVLHALALGALAPLAEISTESALTDRTLTAVLLPPASLPAAGAVPPAPTFSQTRQTRLHRAAAAFPPPAAPPLATQRMQEEAASIPSMAEGRSGEMGGAPPQRASAEPAAGAVAGMPATAGPEAAGLRQYRLALAGEARRFRRYPEAARRAGLSGTAEVRLVVAAGGGVRQTALSRSSGHAVLDAVALDILRQAADRAELPVSLRGQNFAVLLPVVFEVEE